LLQFNPKVISSKNKFISTRLKLKIKKVSKRKVQVYLAGMKDICNSIGLGAEKKYWNFDSKIYDELKCFLNKLGN